MKFFIHHLTWVALVLTTSCHLFAQESFNLKYSFTSGRKYVQNMQLTQKTVWAIEEQEIEVLADFKTRNLFTAESVEKDGTATFLHSVLALSEHIVRPEEDTTRLYTDLNDISRVKYSKTGKIVSAVRTDSSKAVSLL